MTIPRVVAVIMCIAALAAGPCSADTLSNSKLSIHSGLGSNSWNFVKGARPRLIKLLDVTGNKPSLVKAAMPGIVIVGRLYQQNQPTNGDPAQAAWNWWGALNHTILSTPDVDYWEGYNEPGCSTQAEMAWLATFDATRVTILARHGLKASIGNFATGNPNVEDAALMEAFNPAIDAALKAGGILGLHEYNSPNYTNCFNNATGEGWMTGRYRKWYRQYLLPTNRKIPLVISETGIDDTGCGGSPNLGGWQKYCAWWASNYHASDCAAEYVSQLAWYDSLLRADDYVIGATIFQLDCPGWGAWSLAYDDAIPKLMAYMNGVSASEPVNH